MSTSTESERLPTPEVRERLDTHVARLGGALSSPLRLKLIALLSHAPRTVERLAELTKQSIANVSAHLKVLREAGCVLAVREGRFIRYELASPEVAAMARQLQQLSELLVPEVRELKRDYYNQDSTLEIHELPALWPRVETGDVWLIDLRPPEEFEAGHLPGARSYTLDALAALAGQGAPKELIVYCRGPWCLLARAGSARLRELGFETQRLLGSAPEWTAQGYRLHTGAQSPSETPHL